MPDVQSPSDKPVDKDSDDDIAMVVTEDDSNL